MRVDHMLVSILPPFNWVLQYRTIDILALMLELLGSLWVKIKPHLLLLVT